MRARPKSLATELRVRIVWHGRATRVRLFGKTSDDKGTSANPILSHYPEASRNFDRAIELSPRHFHSMIGLAYEIGAADSDTTETLPRYQKASAVAPKYLEAHALLGDYMNDRMLP